jgi:hypothetical protein
VNPPDQAAQLHVEARRVARTFQGNSSFLGPVAGMLSDALKYVSQVGFRIDVEDFRGADPIPAARSPPVSAPASFHFWTTQEPSDSRRLIVAASNQ